MVSIIVRTKNEEKWIESCLKSIHEQNYKDFEIVLIDNMSTDNTVEKAKKYGAKVFTIKDYLPGNALNYGIRKSLGDVIVCLSGHCIAKNNNWLENLIKDLDNSKVAGVYGRQEPMSFSADSDKRDLMIVFGLDKKIQKKDPFFHNANSAFKKETWEKYPFDDNISNIEDRVWGEEVISEGLEIIYEPEASVYHYHGIHQDGNPERLRNVVRIIEKLEMKKGNNIANNISDMKKITAIIPISGDLQYFGGRPLLDYTLLRAKESKLINRIIINSDNTEIIDYARNNGVETFPLRSSNLSKEFVSVNEIFQNTCNGLEVSKESTDIVVGLQITYPFRPVNLIDKMINQLIKDGLDSVIPAYAEYRTALIKKSKKIEFYDESFIPRKFKKNPLEISLIGQGFVAKQNNIKSGNFLGENIGIYELSNPINCIEIRDENSIKSFEALLPNQNYKF